MPEIIIASIDPSVRAGRSERIISATTVAKLPDRSGDYQLDEGTPISLDLSQIRYKPARLVEVTTQGYIDDVYGQGGWGSITVQRRVPTRSWYITVECDAIAGKAKGTDTDRDRPEVLSGVRTIPINRKGIGTQMLPEARELILKLDRPVISCYREADGKWVQTHYYPDYPEMSGIVESQGGPLVATKERENEDDYSWVDTLTQKEMDGIRLALSKIGGRLRVRIQNRWNELTEESGREWRRTHPYGNYI